MKNTFNFRFGLLAILAFITIGLSSCLKDECSEVRHFLEYRPIYVQASQFRIDPVFEESRTFVNPGKIYFYDNMIFINEKYEGIHIIDNSSPENPQNIGFIAIPGNVDVAIRNNKLYADNYADLITVDISDIRNPRLECREINGFDEYWEDAQLGYLVRYEPTERSIAVECSDPNFGDDNFNRNGLIFLAEDANISNNTPDGNLNADGSGTGGSLARFTIAHEHLYIINDRDLIAYAIEGQCPERMETTYVTWAIETIFPYENFLFIGANNGMYIYDASTPSQPTYVSEFRHANACDPVFVKDDIAYVTLRDGTACQNFTNQLEIVDVSDIRNPELIATHEMEHPHGLSVRDDVLYICEGQHGLKAFNTTDLVGLNDNQLSHLKGIHAIDAISLSSDHLLVIGDDGLYQFNTNNPLDIEELSYLAVQR